MFTEKFFLFYESLSKVDIFRKESNTRPDAFGIFLNFTFMCSSISEGRIFNFIYHL